MSRHDDEVRLGHMLQYACTAIRLASGRSRPDLEQDEMLRLALTRARAIEVIGEAASKVSPAGCETYAAIPWSRMVGMRNRLVHGYDKVDLDVLWDTVTVELPSLRKQLRAVLGEASDA